VQSKAALEDSVAASIYAPVHEHAVSRWSACHGKRWMDIFVALVGLLLLLPLTLAIASVIQITSGKPILFRQYRLGRNGRKFELLKFRTMTVTAPANGPGVTRSGDARITRTGRWLRQWKLDELPQLLNVLKGEMSLIGPRPDLEEFWSRATLADQKVLELVPGLTGAASLAFCQEERILAKIPPEQLADFYVEQILPKKALLDMEYAKRATFSSDCRILMRTLLVPLLQSERTKEGDQ
jgi:lipopolysaccharide/colanic/teichoic acid biosynthesis glycosyltransferase